MNEGIIIIIIIIIYIIYYYQSYWTQHFEHYSVHNQKAKQRLYFLRARKSTVEQWPPNRPLLVFLTTSITVWSRISNARV